MDDLIIFGFFALVMFSIDITQNKCIIQATYTNPSIYIILYLHHFLSLFVKFGFLVENRLLLLIYLFTPFIAIIHWKTNKNYCILTQIVNRICNQPDDVKFYDLLELINQKHNKYYYMILSFGWIIGLLRYLGYLNFNYLNFFAKSK